MDSTVEFVWSLNHWLPIHPADWAIQLLESEQESDAILRLTDRNLDWETQNQLVMHVLDDLGRSELLDPRNLRLAYELESIADYFAGKLDGWTLIRRGCDLYYEDEGDDQGRIFWIRLADDADEHGGQGVCIQFPFANNDFDQVLRDAIRNSGRPLPNIGT